MELVDDDFVLFRLLNGRAISREAIQSVHTRASAVRNSRQSFVYLVIELGRRLLRRRRFLLRGQRLGTDVVQRLAAVLGSARCRCLRS